MNELHSCNDSSSVKNLFRGVFLLEIVPRMMLWNFQLHKRNKNALIEQSIVKLLKNELSSEEHDHLSINRGGQPPHHESMIVLCHALTALMLTILNEGGAPYNLVVLQDKDLFRHILDLMNEMIYSGELSFIQHGDGLIETKVPPDSTAYTLDSVALYTLIIQSKF